MRSLSLAILVFTLALVGCGSERPAVVGYDGPIPSDEARTVFDGLIGESFVDEDGALGGGTWTIEGFAVIPNPRTGKSPVALIVSGERRDSLPLLADGDVADLCRRVRGETPREIGGELSSAYRDVWK